MNLEVISHVPGQPDHETPLLFVHGAWHAAWCWEDNFLPYFAERGYAAHALSLRGHGISPGRDRLRWSTIGQYVQDVAQVANGLPRPPVVIGHSMGGLVVQKYLEKHVAPAAVLLASAPSNGVLRTTLNIARHLPLRFLRTNLTLSLWPLVGTPDLAQALFFSDNMPAVEVQRHFDRLQDESYTAFLGMLLFALPRPRRVRTPLLALGAADDAIFTPKEIRSTAHKYGTDAKIYPDMAHDMMLEAGWRQVAEDIDAWLTELSL